MGTGFLWTERSISVSAALLRQTNERWLRHSGVHLTCGCILALVIAGIMVIIISAISMMCHNFHGDHCYSVRHNDDDDHHHRNHLLALLFSISTVPVVMFDSYLEQGSKAGQPLKPPCRPGFSQNFYTVIVSRDVLHGQSILKGRPAEPARLQGEDNLSNGQLHH
ncbi:cadherin-4 isoform X2 [Scomber scombrus]|uniref:Cadherin-4 isoform X2 n=1 Tax=Scomber scombrus TaxID=13677 RepID=A0AAV1NGU9_SCOSC